MTKKCAGLRKSPPQKRLIKSVLPVWRHRAKPATRSLLIWGGGFDIPAFSMLPCSRILHKDAKCVFRITKIDLVAPGQSARFSHCPRAKMCSKVQVHGSFYTLL